LIRIIGGLFKGRKLKSVNYNVRPTTGFTKKRYFDIMNEKLIGSTFLDAFAGTGAVGLEAIGRGADFVVFIEKYKSSLKVIKHNIKKLKIPEEKYLIIAKDYNMAIKFCESRDIKFDCIFIDPPFKHYEQGRNPLKILFKKDVLKNNFIITLERPKEVAFEHKYFNLFREFTTGSSIVSFFNDKNSG